MSKVLQIAISERKETEYPALRRPYRLAPAVFAGLSLVAGLIVGRRAWANRPLRRVCVAGSSMEPALRPDDRLLVVRGGRAWPGKVVMFDDPREPGRILIKRVVSHHGQDLVVAGDNPSASTDSRHFGPVSTRDLHGWAFYRYRPKYRRGRL